jgi:hypothetical protein
MLKACSGKPRQKTVAQRPNTSWTGMAIGHPEVAIFDGDPVVRGALEVLLQAAGYRIRLLCEPVEEELEDLLVDVHLLLIAPELGVERRNALLTMTSNPTALVKLPILELLPEGGEQQVKGGRVVLWPCSTEELRRAIHAALFGEG